MLEKNSLEIIDNGHKFLKVALNGIELKNVIEYTLHREPGEVSQLSIKLYVTDFNCPNDSLPLNTQPKQQHS